MGRLDGKVAIITGGASGIGAQIVKRFLEEGATVIAADISTENIQKTDNLVGKKLDVSSEEQWKQLTNEVIEQFGKIDILVNNAGVSTEKGLQNFDYADWERMSKINGFGTMVGMKYVIPHMVEQKAGSIVNLSSFTALIGMGL